MYFIGQVYPKLSDVYLLTIWSRFSAEKGRNEYIYSIWLNTLYAFYFSKRIFDMKIT